MKIFEILTDKSWATPGLVEVRDRSAGIGPAARTCMMFFLAVLTSVFMLFVVSYRLRMGLPDWQPISDPNILWLNTALLIASSFAMQAAKGAAAKGSIKSIRLSFSLAGILTVAFLFGQMTAWEQLSALGLYTPRSPAYAFFFLLTGLHALHLAGGLVAWFRTAVKVWRGDEVSSLRLSVDMCTTYWHYLLIVWFVFFALLSFT
jgi:cytochrome c oxidase subunit 3